ncbi:hypothetical protein JP75_07560 [Devosia riboflavina]|uniref:DUF968 domain-containing protein n=1 Tax=Devosia riboflavina TaxID=46914 RepID=A0A087M3F9_9HYPH|nr:hypothetical protein [Devosia riboflavina]KFL31412.1 hypothetical protein JP75_07560 [Devosia riboflavina]
MTASRVNRPDTAFSLDGLRQKQPRRHDKQHMAWLHELPSVVPGHEPVQVAHIRYADDRYGKRSAGTGLKPSDCWTVPLAADQHRRQHSMNERQYWEAVGIDPILIAALLYAVSGDTSAGTQIIRNARQISRRAA